MKEPMNTTKTELLEDKIKVCMFAGIVLEIIK